MPWWNKNLLWHLRKTWKNVKQKNKWGNIIKIMKKNKETWQPVGLSQERTLCKSKAYNATNELSLSPFPIGEGKMISTF